MRFIENRRKKEYNGSREIVENAKRRHYKMLMRNFLTSRKSVREFKGKKLSKEAVRGVENLVASVNEKAAGNAARFRFIEDGDKLYKQLEGIGGYAGVMIKAPSYLILDVDNTKADSYLRGAYYMEELITGLIEYGLGSCWISLQNVSPDNRAPLKEWEAEQADFMLALGYPANKGLGEEPSSSRLGIEDFVYKEDIGQPITVEELEQLGLDDLFHYVRYAPSQYNEQPWRYVVKPGQVDMYMKDMGRNYLVEAGIAMYYFEKMLHTLSIPGEFEHRGLDDQGDHKYIASIRV